jgi:hypothetical protein
MEAWRATAYWLLLFSDFPRHGLDLFRFLFQRLRYKPLTWHGSSPDFGPIITSGWRLRMHACLTWRAALFEGKKASQEWLIDVHSFLLEISFGLQGVMIRVL